LAEAATTAFRLFLGALDPLEDSSVFGRFFEPAHATAVRKRIAAHDTFALGGRGWLEQDQALVRMPRVYHVHCSVVGCVEKRVSGMAVHTGVAVLAAFLEDWLNISAKECLVEFGLPL